MQGPHLGDAALHDEKVRVVDVELDGVEQIRDAAASEHQHRMSHAIVRSTCVETLASMNAEFVKLS